MSRDKLEGFLIGLGTGVLVAGFMEIREQLAKSRAGQESEHTRAVPIDPGRISQAPEAARAAHL